MSWSSRSSNTGTTDLNDLPGQPEFTTTITADNGAPVSVLSITSASVGAGQIPGSRRWAAARRATCRSRSVAPTP